MVWRQDERDTILILSNGSSLHVNYSEDYVQIWLAIFTAGHDTMIPLSYPSASLYNKPDTVLNWAQAWIKQYFLINHKIIITSK